MSTVGTIYDETIKYGFAKLLSTQTASNSTSIAFTAPFVGDLYDTYVFDLFGLAPSVDTFLAMRFSTDGGATWAATDYWTQYIRQDANASAPVSYGSIYQGVAWQATFVLSDFQYSTGNPGRLSGRVRFNRAYPSGGAGVRNVEWQLAHHCSNPGSTNTFAQGGGGWVATNYVNGVLFFYSGGNIVSGSIRCYGLKGGT